MEYTPFKLLPLLLSLSLLLGAFANVSVLNYAPGQTWYRAAAVGVPCTSKKGLPRQYCLKVNDFCMYWDSCLYFWYAKAFCLLRMGGQLSCTWGCCQDPVRSGAQVFFVVVPAVSK